jgi:hypothetical protein
MRKAHNPPLASEGARGLSIRLTNDQYQALRRWAYDNEWPLGEAVRQAISRAIPSYEEVV